MADKQKLFAELSDSVLNFDEEKAVRVANEVIAAGIDAFEAINEGLSVGMNQASKLFDEEEYFVPELLLCSDAMYAGLDVLKPHVKADSAQKKYKVVIGVIQGDTHDIGKNLVKIMLETSGYEIYDFGRDISPEAFVDKAVEVQADVIALSTLMTTTMVGMDKVIRILKERGIRDQFKVIIGGGPVSANYAAKIGANAYSANAVEALVVLRELLGGAA